MLEVSEEIFLSSSLPEDLLSQYLLAFPSLHENMTSNREEKKRMEKIGVKGRRSVIVFKVEKCFLISSHVLIFAFPAH